MQDFKKFEFWKKSHELTKKVYEKTKGFPKEELYGLTSQIRRASVSIPTNIAEGAGRKSNKEFSHFLQISLGSACEVEYLLLLAYELSFLEKEVFTELTNGLIEIRKMLTSFIKKLNV